VAGTGDVYFDTAAMVLLLFTLGRYPEAQGRLPAMRSLARISHQPRYFAPDAAWRGWAAAAVA
jgi:cation transport ATPase